MTHAQKELHDIINHNGNLIRYGVYPVTPTVDVYFRSRLRGKLNVGISVGYAKLDSKAKETINNLQSFAYRNGVETFVYF